MLQQVKRDDRVQELYITKRFIQSEEWKTIYLEQPCPDGIRKNMYTKDYVKYNGEKYYPNITNSLKFSEIVHATGLNKLMSIISDGGLKPGRKSIPDCTLNSFVWFGMKIAQAEVDALRSSYIVQCRMEEQSFFTDNSVVIDCCSIVNSPCFEPMSRYGEFKLTFEIRNVIKAYSQQFCPKDEMTNDLTRPDFRILGTFIYKMEIMHTVLVCPPDTPGAEKYPLLDQIQTTVICEDHQEEGTFIWCPDSTGDKDKADASRFQRGPYRRWEHVTFAFYVPDDVIFKLDNVSSHISCCIYVNPKEGYRKSSINDTIQMFLDKVNEVSTIETRRWMVNLLIRSIRGYLDEEKIFENMSILYTYQPVDLDTVVDRVDELLDGEEFDWSPLIECMKGVQQTRNTAVLSSY